MLPYLREQWGNPSSLYGPGRQARQALDRARRTCGEILGCASDEIIFTGSGSEGANLAIKGLANAAPAHRRQIITSRVEHHAVLEACAEFPQLRGGGQERGRRAGTENVASIVGMATALQLAQSARESTNHQLWQMVSRLLRELPARVPDCRVTGHPRQRLPNHASFAFGQV